MSFLKSMASASLIVVLTAGIAAAQSGGNNYQYTDGDGNVAYGTAPSGGTMAMGCSKSNWAAGAEVCNAG